jgi:hypothetical protein
VEGQVKSIQVVRLAHGFEAKGHPLGVAMLALLPVVAGIAVYSIDRVMPSTLLMLQTFRLLFYPFFKRGSAEHPGRRKAKLCGATSGDPLHDTPP